MSLDAADPPRMAQAPPREHGRIEGDHDITFEVISDENGLERVAPEWTAVNALIGPEGFFTRMELVRANWARHRKDPRTFLNVLVIRDRGRLVFGAPMLRRRDRLGTHVLQWLDSRTPFYDGLLVDPGMDPTAAARLFTYYLEASWTRRALKIAYVLEGTALHRVLVAAGFRLTQRTVAPCVDLTVYETWDAYLAAMPASRRQQYRNLSRRLGKAGAGPLHIVTDPDERRLEIARIFSRKREWVKEHDLPDWIVPPETEAWFQWVAAREDARNRTHVLRLAAGDEWIASSLCLERDGTIFSSKMAFNPAWERFSPGWVLTLEKIRFAIGRQLSSVDFMIGRTPWKDRVADQFRSSFACRVNLLPGRRSLRLPR
ncbi:GNAT family N-acetyltransferase [Aquibium carbonis]|uniref:GNAT family N-acetyltransferase n=1 Tax=Aquibium carbonis TaxID=2495581 RepID=A0A429YSL2_9HYPH|nr:GNAT family N-acetyltransferase [Aquibium carbonis]RST84431.1 GNAT family N-acetyltransferase [Aquibium carbonis]